MVAGSLQADSLAEVGRIAEGSPAAGDNPAGVAVVGDNPAGADNPAVVGSLAGVGARIPAAAGGRIPAPVPEAGACSLEAAGSWAVFLLKAGRESHRRGVANWGPSYFPPF